MPASRTPSAVSTSTAVPSASNRPARNRRAPDRYEPSFESTTRAAHRAGPKPPAGPKGRPKPKGKWVGYALEPIPVKEEPAEEELPEIKSNKRKGKERVEDDDGDDKPSPPAPLPPALPLPPVPLLTRPTSPLILYSFIPGTLEVERTDVETLLADMLPPPPPPDLIVWDDDEPALQPATTSDAPTTSLMDEPVPVPDGPKGRSAKGPNPFARDRVGLNARSVKREGDADGGEGVQAGTVEESAGGGGMREMGGGKKEMAWDEQGWEDGL